MSKQHVHAELYAELAEIAKITDKPWEHFEICFNNRWETVKRNHYLFIDAYTYRRKPRTITVNGFEVPEPLRVMPEVDGEYFLADPAGNGFLHQFFWRDCATDNLWLERGLLHSTKEAAIAHAKAMLGIDPNE